MEIIYEKTEFRAEILRSWPERTNRKPLIYLASPHNSKASITRERRYKAVVKVTAILMKDGYFIYSPIVHSHEVSKEIGKEYALHYDFWKTYDHYMISLCDIFVVLMIPGWDISVGVSDEINYSNEIHKRILYLDPKVKDWTT